MGNNAAFAVWEQVVIDAYDKGILTLEMLDTFSEVYRGTDIDSGGSQDLQARDGKFVQEIVVGLVKPDFVTSEPAEGEKWDYNIHWNEFDEFLELKYDRWGWR